MMVTWTKKASVDLSKYNTKGIINIAMGSWGEGSVKTDAQASALQNQIDGWVILATLEWNRIWWWW